MKWSPARSDTTIPGRCVLIEWATADTSNLLSSFPVQAMSDKPAMVAFRPTFLVPAIKERQGRSAPTPGAVVKRDLERYYRVIDDETRRLRDRLSDTEWLLVIDVLSAIEYGPDTYRLLWASVAAELDDRNTGQKEIDADALIAKLRDLTPGAAMALVDFAERFKIGEERENGQA